MDKKKIVNDAKAKISELSKKQDETYLSMLSELNIEKDSHLSDYLFDYCFNDFDCGLDFDAFDEND